MLGDHCEQATDRESMFRSIVEHVRDIVWVLDGDRRVTFVNRSIDRLLGYRQEQQVGVSVLEFVHPDDHFKFLSALRCAIARPGVTSEIIHRLRHQGESWSKVQSSVLAGIDDDRGDRIVMFSRDITVAQRTADRQMDLRRRLRDARRWESVGPLAVGLAQNLSNLLTTVLARDESQPREIVATTDHGGGLIRSLLLLERKLTDEHVPLRLGSDLHEVVNSVRSGAPTNIDFRIVIAAIDATVLGNEEQLRRLVAYLCEQAVDSMRDQGGILEIRLEEIFVGNDLARRLSQINPGQHVRLSVSDTGRGVPPASRERMLSAVETDRNPELDATLDAHGAAVELGRESAGGSSLRLYLPICELAD